jgi:hypothetical protein
MTNRDLANATRLARWIVANGYRSHMTRKMVLGLLPERSERAQAGAERRF